MTKNVKRLYKRIAKDYVKEYWGKSSPYDKYIDMFLSFLPKSARILDAGCGAGDSVSYFISKGFRAEGVDISPDMLRIARAKTPDAKFRVMDIRSLKFGDGIFDGVYSYGVFEHLPKADMFRVLKGYARVLKKSGFIFINPPKGKGQHLTYWPLANDKFKASFYNITELKNLLRKAGFEVIFCEAALPFFKRGTSYTVIFTIAKKRF